MKIIRQSLPSILLRFSWFCWTLQTYQHSWRLLVSHLPVCDNRPFYPCYKKRLVLQYFWLLCSTILLHPYLKCPRSISKIRQRGLACNFSSSTSLTERLSFSRPCLSRALAWLLCWKIVFWVSFSARCRSHWDHISSQIGFRAQQVIRRKGLQSYQWGWGS